MSGRKNYVPVLILNGTCLSRNRFEKNDRMPEVRLLVSLAPRVPLDDAVWPTSMFSKNRDRLFDGDVVTQFLTTTPMCCSIAPLAQGSNSATEGIS